MATTVADLVAQLRADTAQFDAALAGAQGKLAGLSTAGARASSGLSSSLTKVGSTMESVGKKFSSVGRTMTTHVTLPVAAIGYVATKAALNFNTAFAKIDALAGNIGTSMDDAKKHVEALAASTGQAPQDLADSLYFIASAGLKASKVMPTLDITAKAAAAGMGSAAEIGQTLTSVLNAYAGTGLDAAKSMNILTEAVKVGKAETSDFATGLGPIIGVAANAGISLNELTGAIAQATNLGIPFARAVTGLRFGIQSLEAPTTTASSALEHFGINAGDLAAMVADPNVGLVGTLQYLYNTLNDGSEAGRQAWSKITGGARSSIVAVDLVGKHQQQTNHIIQEMGAAASDSSKVFQTAYGKIQATPAFKFQQALAQLENAAIDLGNSLIPILIHDVIPAIQSVVHWFDGLSEHTKSLAVRFAIAAAVGGPILSFVGGLLRIGGAATKAVGWLVGSKGLSAAVASVGDSGAITRIGAAIAGLTTPIGLVITAIGGIALAWYEVKQHEQDVAAATDTLVKKLESGASAAALKISAAASNRANPPSLFTQLQQGQDVNHPLGTDQLKEFAAAQARVRSETISAMRAILGEDQALKGWGVTIANTTASLDNKKAFATFIAGVQDSGIHIQDWASSTATALAAGGHFTDAMNVMAQSVSKSDLLGALDKLGGSISSNERSTIKGEIANHHYAAAFYAIEKAAKAAADSEQHSIAQMRALTETVLTNTNAYNALGVDFNYYNKLSVSQSALIERNVNKLYEQGDALTKDEQQALRAALAHGKFAKAQEIVQNALQHANGVLGSYDAKLGKTVEATLKNNRAFDIMGNALINNNKLTVRQTQTLSGQINRLYDSGKALTVAQQAALNNALAAGKFKKAEDILSDAIRNNTIVTGVNGKAAQTWKEHMLSSTDSTKRQSDALKFLTDQLPNNTKNLADNVKKLIDQASKADTTKEKIDLLRRALEDMARGKYDINLTANTQQAQQQMQDLFNKMQSAGFQLSRTPGGPPGGAGTGRRHSGGMVGDDGLSDFAGKRRPDERAIIALRDEMVVNPQSTRKYRRELEAINADRYHDGGAIDPSVITAVTDRVQSITAGLKNAPTFVANIQFSDAMLKYLASQFASSNVILAAAKTQLGVPYRWGASNPEGPEGGPGAAFDCSGLTMWAAAQAHLSLYHHAATQYQQLPHTGNPQPGDFAFFGNPVHHVGIVSDRKGQMIDAPHTGASVRYDPFFSDLVGFGDTHAALARQNRQPGGHSHIAADNGAYMTKRADVSMMPGEIALAPNSTRSISALSKALSQAARMHDGGFVPIPPGQQGGGGGGGSGLGGHGGGDGGGGHGDNGDGFHFGKYRRLLRLEKAGHIDDTIKTVKQMYAKNDQTFPFDYVMKSLHDVTRKELDKVAPHRESLRDFVKHLAQNIEPWAGRGHGGGGGGNGGGGDGGGNGKGPGYGLFQKVFGGFSDTLAKTTTPELAKQFMAALMKEYRNRKSLDLGELTRVVDAMFQEVPAENYLNALTTSWENVVHGKTVQLVDKKGQNFSATAAILKMLGAHKGTGGDGTGGGDGSKGQLAFHFGKYKKLLGMEHKYDHPKDIDKVLKKVEDDYKKQGHLPYDYMKQTLSSIDLRELHKVSPNAKNILEFLHKLNDGIDHSPGGQHAGGHGGGHGDGHGGGGGGGHLADVVKKLDHVWSQGASRALSWNEVTDIAHSVGYNQHKGVIMSAISAPESGRQPHPRDNVNTNGSRDKGILQFNSVHHLPNSIVYNPVESFKRAKGWDLSNWATYNNGAYRHFLSAAQHAWGGWHGSGLDTVFTKPTTIGVGERGAERVQVTPLGQDNDWKIQLRVDRKRFNRDMDYDYVTSGR